jgi:hypothetical protein
MTAWKLPFVVAGIMLPIVLGFYVGGAGVGLAAGALTVVVIVYAAARQLPRGPIASAPAWDSRAHVLLVAAAAVEEPEDVQRIVRAAELEDGGGERGAGVLVLAPARIRFLDRWASDVEDARRAAQRNLVATVAALAKAGIEAEARVGDEDVVQAVEDQLQTFPAERVVLVSGGGEVERDGAAAGELAERLEADFRHVVIMSAG